MDKKEFSLFASALRTYYPREKLLPNEPAMQLWYNQLKDIPYNVAEATLNKWVATEKWSPSIADIRKTASEMVNGVPDDWGKGWEKVEKAIRHYGQYREAEALAEMDDLTRQTVERLGFKNICISENIIADRANFRTIYEQLAQRKETENQIPESLKALINKMPTLALGEGAKSD